MSKPKTEIVYVETVSVESYVLVENLTKVSTALRLIENLGCIEYEDIQASSQALRELERSIRFQIRENMIETEPKRLPEEIMRKIEQRIRRKPNEFM